MLSSRKGAFHKALAVILSFSVILFTTPQTVKADEPITSIIIAVATVVAAGAAVYSALNDEGSKNVNVNVDPPVQAVETSKDVDVDVNGKIAPTKTVTLPDDAPEILNAFPFAEINEVDTFEIIDNSELRVTTDGVNRGTIAPTTGQLNDSPVIQIPHIDFNVTRTASITWTRPPEAVGDGTMSVEIDIQSLNLGTTSLAGTTGHAGWELSISSAELGSLFQTSGIVTQDGSLTTTGAIPVGDYVSTPGSGQATLAKLINLEIPVPTALQTVSYEVSIRTFGVGDEVGTIPTLGPIGLVLFSFILLGVFMVILWRRGTFTNASA